VGGGERREREREREKKERRERGERQRESARGGLETVGAAEDVAWYVERGCRGGERERGRE
jgi:hypothetical protein